MYFLQDLVPTDKFINSEVTHSLDSYTLEELRSLNGLGAVLTVFNCEVSYILTPEIVREGIKQMVESNDLDLARRINSYLEQEGYDYSYVDGMVELAAQGMTTTISDVLDVLETNFREELIKPLSPEDL